MDERVVRRTRARRVDSRDGWTLSACGDDARAPQARSRVRARQRASAARRSASPGPRSASSGRIDSLSPTRESARVRRRIPRFRMRRGRSPSRRPHRRDNVSSACFASVRAAQSTLAVRERRRLPEAFRRRTCTRGTHFTGRCSPAPCGEQGVAAIRPGTRSRSRLSTTRWRCSSRGSRGRGSRRMRPCRVTSRGERPELLLGSPLPRLIFSLRRSFR